MKFILGIGAVLFLLVTPPPAQAETITLNCPSSVVEGGLVAQQVGNCPASPRTDSCGTIPSRPTQQQLNAFYQCKISSWTGDNTNYCEFRDQPGVNNSRTAFVGTKAREAYRIAVTNADGGYYFAEFVNLLGYGSMNSTTASTGFNFNINAGEDMVSTAYMSGFPQYSKGTAGQGVLNIHKGGTATGTILASCTVNIRDDDNSAYVGRRRHHPYDGTWRTTPYCTGPVNCGWD